MDSDSGEQKTISSISMFLIFLPLRQKNPGDEEHRCEDDDDGTVDE
jgi:hypothetical protein